MTRIVPLGAGDYAMVERDHGAKDWPRNLQQERITTCSAARRAGVPYDGHEITVYAEGRATLAPVKDAMTRDFLTEAAEEFADGRNYLCWGIRALDQRPDRDAPDVVAARAYLTRALGGTCMVFEHVTAAGNLLDRPVAPPASGQDVPRWPFLAVVALILIFGLGIFALAKAVV